MLAGMNQKVMVCDWLTEIKTYRILSQPPFLYALYVNRSNICGLEHYSPWRVTESQTPLRD